MYSLNKINIKVVGNIIYLPIYMLMFFQKTEIDNVIYKIDLSGLK